MQGLAQEVGLTFCEFPSCNYWLGWRLDLPSDRDQWPEPGRHELDYGITINLTPQSTYNFPTEKTSVTELEESTRMRSSGSDMSQRVKLSLILFLYRPISHLGR